MLSEIQKKIKDCETAYIGCFTENFENSEIIRYRDSQLQDMYNHNFTYVKKSLPRDDLKKVINQEIEQNLKENKDFCRFTFDELPDIKLLDEFHPKFQIEHYGAYAYIPMKSPEWKVLKECQILKINNYSMVEDLMLIDMICDRETLGEDFCNRRARRRGVVYLSELPLDSYICYYDKTPVGKCDLFIHNGTAKIEDFVVIPEYQRKGIGSTILKYLIDEALGNRAETVYLTTDEDDTAKEMYQKLGFEKVSDMYALFVKL